MADSLIGDAMGVAFDLLMKAVLDVAMRIASFSALGAPDFVVGYDVQLRELKAMLLKDGVPIVVLSTPGGSGKTTLAKLLCNDDEIKVSHQKQHVGALLKSSEELSQTYEKTRQQGYKGYRSRSPCSGQGPTKPNACRSLDEGLMPKSSCSRPTEIRKEEAEILKDEEATTSVDLTNIFVKD
ncbi:Hypothetical predicted protein [Olea europaea subsp. europaea]|uniref:Uncharacterized protein n=1 Tax=Olea europaea subsp. europaea TaxID=158383 RepID=A0A8S0Q5G9_OLEEU|nr:Hypothetical predicted protein [Olea europaea subsp. europaea]